MQRPLGPLDPVAMVGSGRLELAIGRDQQLEEAARAVLLVTRRIVVKHQDGVARSARTMALTGLSLRSGFTLISRQMPDLPIGSPTPLAKRPFGARRPEPARSGAELLGREEVAYLAAVTQMGLSGWRRVLPTGRNRQ